MACGLTPSSDYNYQRAVDGSCQLVAGQAPPDHSMQCKNDPGLVEYFEPTGYRRIPLTTCQGGKQLDMSTAHPCPGKEEEFNERRGLHGFALLCVIFFPIAAAAAIGYYIYRRSEGKFGQIRLGEESSESPFLHYPVVVLSAIIAVALTLPQIARSGYTSIRNLFTRNRRFTSRSSFTRRAYAPVSADESLLGDSEDEDDAV